MEFSEVVDSLFMLLPNSAIFDLPGVFNDLGSGGNIDICVVTKTGKEHLRKFRSPNQRAYHAEFPPFPKGRTVVQH